MTNIEDLLNRYETPQGDNRRVKGEMTSKEYWQRERQEANRKHRHLILDQLRKEVPYHYTNDEIEQIRYWIDKFNLSFKEFHRQSSNETIILAFLLIHWKRKNPKFKVSDLAISNKYDLDNNKFTLIQNRLIFQLMRATELTYNQRKYVENYENDDDQ